MTASKSNPAKEKDRNPPPPGSRRPRRPADGPRGVALRFSPAAWAKLLYLRDRGPTEIGAFGVASGDDPLHVQDVVPVRQEAGPASVAFDDEAVADYFDDQVDAGLPPERFARIWVHTHPGGSPSPSATDEETFRRAFGGCQWAAMLVLARDGSAYARLRFNVGPGGEAEIPVEVDFSRPFAGSDAEAWEAEYTANVRKPLREGVFAMDEGEALGDALDALGWGGERLAEALELDPECREVLRRRLETAGPEEAEEVLDGFFG